MAVTTIKPPPFTRVIVLQFTAAALFAALVGAIAGEDKGVVAYSAFLGRVNKCDTRRLFCVQDVSAPRSERNGKNDRLGV